ncbi:MAG: hypothetical protein U0W24_14515 [Bacteroidales bacterium]
MNRYLVKFTVFTLTILTANLLGDIASDFLTSYKADLKPFVFTLLAMTVIVAIFYPLFEYLDKWILKLTKRAVREGKSLAGRNTGIILVFTVSILILVYFYMKQWYGLDFIKVILNGKISRLI